jgi:uncharacterized membrane protein YidH (DUF202 family)
MRFFDIVNLQHALGSLLVPLIFMVLFGVGLSVMPLVQSKEKKPSEELHFNDDIREGDNPFPMVMALIIVGTIVWALFYILYYGLSEVTL